MLPAAGLLGLGIDPGWERKGNIGGEGGEEYSFFVSRQLPPITYCDHGMYEAGLAAMQKKECLFCCNYL